MLRGNKEADYKDLDWKIHSLNIDIGIHIAGIEHYIEVLDRSTENVENDRTIYRKLMKSTASPAQMSRKLVKCNICCASNI